MKSQIINQKALFYTKDPLITVQPDDNKSPPLEQITKFLLTVALEYDSKSQEIFMQFIQFTQKSLLHTQTVSRKPQFQLCRIITEKLQPFLKSRVIKPSSTVASYRKPLRREIELTARKLPPRTKIYIGLNYNLRLDEHQTLESMIGPRSLDLLCNLQDFQLFETMKRNLAKLGPLPLSSIPKLVYMIKRFQGQYGLNLNNVRTLSAFLDMNVTSIGYYWLSEAKKTLEEPAINKKKIYTQKYIRFFCNICQIYACNFHFLQKDDFLVEEDENPEYSYYNTFYNIPKKQLYIQNFKENQVYWVNIYRCSKDLGSYCYRALDPKLDISMVETITMKKYQKELINHCITFNMITPCFMYLLCKSVNPQETTPCLKFYLYIMQNQLLKKRDELLKTLKLSVEMENKTVNSEKLNQIKKNMYNPKKLWKTKHWNKDQEFIEYIPCFHENACTEDCYCIKTRGYCEKYCCCSLFCEFRFKGCSCVNGECSHQTCECFQNQRECDPDACLKCNAKNNKHLLEIFNVKMPVCKNSCLTYRVKRRLVLGKSTICEGLGIFAGQMFKKGDFIGEYTGEVLNFEEAEKRGRVYSNMSVYYLFTLNNNNIIDAYMYGNKTRFINHGSFGIDNANVKIMYCQGEHKIGIYAQKDIAIGDEVLFDYGNKFKVPWLLEFNERMKRKHKDIMRKKKEKKVLREEVQLFETNVDDDYAFML